MKYLTPKLLSVLLLLSCATPEPYPETTALDLVIRSHVDYNHNDAGLIGPQKLNYWLQDWSANRPKNVLGDLVILQTNEAAGTDKYLKSKTSFVTKRGKVLENKVRVYVVDVLTELYKVRSNGLLAIGLQPADGLTIDAFLKKYNIRPGLDYVLFVQGNPQERALQNAARGYLALRYWGFSAKHLAVLNGSVSTSVPVGDRTSEVPVPPNNGTSRIIALHNNQFVLLATLQHVLDAVKNNGPIIDSRSTPEFQATSLGTTDTDTSCASPPCTPTYSGRLKGAIHLEWSELINPDYSIKTLNQIDTLLAAKDIKPHKTYFVYDLDGHRSAVTAFVLSSVAGVPVRWYANGYIEWGALNHGHPTSTSRRVAADSPWRTDLPNLSEPEPFSYASNSTLVKPTIFNPNVRDTDKFRREDLEYKKFPPVIPGSGGGGLAGGNPCGG